MRILIFTILVFYNLTLSAQADSVFIRRATAHSDDVDSVTYDIDTIVFKSRQDRHLLIGTSVLNSEKTYNAYNNHGLLLHAVESSKCTERREVYEDKLVSVNRSDSLLVVEVNIYDNCGYSFLCEIDVKDKVLNIIANGYGIYYSCDCNYTLKYFIRILDTDKEYPIQHYMINGIPAHLPE